VLLEGAVEDRRLELGRMQRERSAVAWVLDPRDVPGYDLSFGGR
jgi:hypothetical protein